MTDLKSDFRAGQFMLAALGYYKAAIDGLIGPRSEAAADIVLRNMGLDVAGWPRERKFVGAMQRILDTQGYELGVIDGWWGHNTHEAFTGWLSDRAGTDWTVRRDPVPAAPSPVVVPRQSECVDFYGHPQHEVAARLTSASLPLPMRLDWNLGQTVSRITIHEFCAPSLEHALADVIDEYGEDQWRALGLDRFAGGYVKRKMRGGSSWSMHAYGCAIDIYAAPNGLRTRCPEALFCGADYRTFLDIMESHGLLPAVRLWGADAMHFQRARMG